MKNRKITEHLPYALSMAIIVMAFIFREDTQAHLYGKALLSTIFLLFAFALFPILFQSLSYASQSVIFQKYQKPVSDMQLMLAAVSLAFPALFLFFDHIIPAEGKSFSDDFYFFVLRSVCIVLLWNILNIIILKSKNTLIVLLSGILFLWSFIIFFHDWNSSPDPNSIFPFYGISGIFLSGFSFLGLGLKYENDKEKCSIFGQLLLVFAFIWVYFMYSQYLILSYHDDLFPYTGAPWIILVILLAFNFIIPFILLIFKKVRSRGSNLFYISLLIISGRFLDHYFLAFSVQGFSATGLVIFLFLTGLYAMTFFILYKNKRDGNKNIYNRRNI
jgi:hypothetical protein